MLFMKKSHHIWKNPHEASRREGLGVQFPIVMCLVSEIQLNSFVSNHRT